MSIPDMKGQLQQSKDKNKPRMLVPYSVPLCACALLLTSFSKMIFLHHFYVQEITTENDNNFNLFQLWYYKYCDGSVLTHV